MTPAMWVVGVLALVFWALTRQAFVEAIGDDVGAGVIAVVGLLLAIALTVAWLVLAAVHWWPF